MNIERERPYLAIYCIVCNGDGVLMLRRANTGYADGKWSFPAGHVDEGESLTLAASRELKEETGLDIPQKNWEFLSVMHRRTTDRRVIDVFMKATDWQGNPVNNEPHKCSELEFVSLSNCELDVVDYIAPILFLYLEMQYRLILSGVGAIVKMIKSVSPKVITENTVEAYKSGLLAYRDYSGTATVVRDYEKALEEYLQVNHVIAVSSGTAAIHSGLVALGVKKGSRVAVPAICAVMTVLPLIQLGAIPVVIDSDGDSFCMLPDQLEREMLKGLTAVIACGMWGNPGTSEAMLVLSEQYGVPILEDAAQSFGASTSGGGEGLKGKLGCFSTHEYKLLSTGEGGFIATNDADIAARLRVFIRVGYDGKAYGNLPGVNYKLSGFQAIAGKITLGGIGNYISHRQNLCAAWKECLSDLPNLSCIPMVNDGTSAPYACTMLFNDHTDGVWVAKELASRGLVTDPYRYELKPITHYPVFSEFHPGDRSLGHAESLIQKLLVLPVNENINLRDIEEGSRVIKSILKL